MSKRTIKGLARMKRRMDENSQIVTKMKSMIHQGRLSFSLAMNKKAFSNIVRSGGFMR